MILIEDDSQLLMEDGSSFLAEDHQEAQATVKGSKCAGRSGGALFR